MQLKDILENFDFDNNVLPYGNGHINETYISDNIIVQKINTKIFTNPKKLMENIDNITNFLRNKIIKAGGDPDRETLTIIKNKNGKIYYKSSKGDYYRAYKYINSSISYETVSCETLYEAAKAFGRFQNMLDDYPAHELYETIPNFHHTPKRFDLLKEAIKNDSLNRLKNIQKEVAFALSLEKDAGTIVDGITCGDIPLRVTHNDTKLNNVLFDKTTNKAICVIDLDTVMPGSLLYDYGDALRFGATSGAEDEKELDKIYFELDKFESFTKGFLEEVGSKLTPREIELLPFSAKLLSLECGIRFLTDYLNGDTYFKIHYQEQNLDRARTQLKLVSDIEQKLNKMTQIVKKYI